MMLLDGGRIPLPTIGGNTIPLIFRLTGILRYQLLVAEPFRRRLRERMPVPSVAAWNMPMQFRVPAAAGIGASTERSEVKRIARRRPEGAGPPYKKKQQPCHFRCEIEFHKILNINTLPPPANIEK